MRRVYQLYDIRWVDERVPRPVIISGKKIYIASEDREKAEGDARAYLNLVKHSVEGTLNLVDLGEEEKVGDLENAFFVMPEISRGR